MTWIANLLEGELIIRPDAVERDESQTSVEVTAEENDGEEEKILEYTPTVAILTSLDASPLIVVEPKDFDPYNAGRFESSKSRLKE